MPGSVYLHGPIYPENQHLASIPRIQIETSMLSESTSIHTGAECWLCRDRPRSESGTLLADCGGGSHPRNRAVTPPNQSPSAGCQATRNGNGNPRSLLPPPSTRPVVYPPAPWPQSLTPTPLITTPDSPFGNLRPSPSLPLVL